MPALASKRIARKATARKAKSGLPAPIPGEPFSLLGTLKRCTRLLSPEDAAEILGCNKKTIYAHIKSGKIPVADLGFDLLRIDPKAWAHVLEHDNRHLLPSVRAIGRAA